MKVLIKLITCHNFAIPPSFVENEVVILFVCPIPISLIIVRNHIRIQKVDKFIFFPILHIFSQETMPSKKLNIMVAYSCFVHIKQMKLISFRSELFLLFHIEKLDFMLSFESLLLEQGTTYLYVTDSTLVCPVKMEYIFVLKMMMKSGLEKINV